MTLATQPRLRAGHHCGHTSDRLKWRATLGHGGESVLSAIAHTSSGAIPTRIVLCSTQPGVAIGRSAPGPISHYGMAKVGSELLSIYHPQIPNNSPRRVCGRIRLCGLGRAAGARQGVAGGHTAAILAVAIEQKPPILGRSRGSCSRCRSPGCSWHRKAQMPSPRQGGIYTVQHQG